MQPGVARCYSHKTLNSASDHSRMEATTKAVDLRERQPCIRFVKIPREFLQTVE